MFNVGASIRMIDHQTSRYGGNPQLLAIREELQSALDDYDKQLKTKYEVRHYPLRNLVAMNLSSLLVAIEYSKKTSVRPQLYPN